MSKNWNLYEGGQRAKSAIFKDWADDKHTWDTEVKDHLSGVAKRLGALTLHGTFDGQLTASIIDTPYQDSL